jgi:hypothetical protein
VRPVTVVPSGSRLQNVGAGEAAEQAAVEIAERMLRLGLSKTGVAWIAGLGETWGSESALKTLSRALDSRGAKGPAIAAALREFEAGLPGRAAAAGWGPVWAVGRGDATRDRVVHLAAQPGNGKTLCTRSNAGLGRRAGTAPTCSQCVQAAARKLQQTTPRRKAG